MYKRQVITLTRNNSSTCLEVNEFVIMETVQEVTIISSLIIITAVSAILLNVLLLASVCIDKKLVCENKSMKLAMLLAT